MSRILPPSSKRESVAKDSDSKTSRRESQFAAAAALMSTDGRQSSLRSWSGENTPQSPDLVNDVDSDAETDGSEVLPEEEVVTYDPPPANFIRILFGDSNVLVANSNCGRKIFMDYVISKIDVKHRLYGGAQLDLCSEDGIFLKLEKLDENDNIDHLFQHGETYLPCIVYMTGGTFLESIKPCLKRWEKLYPSLLEKFIRTIKMEQEDAEPKVLNFAARWVKHSEERKARQHGPRGDATSIPEAKKLERAAATPATVPVAEKEKEKHSDADKKKKGK
ncbi:hypothetical protein BsWGS_12879 [Bradybaena similaris]